MNKLYDKHLKAALGKPHHKVFELSDGRGLSARISITGKIRWQYRYKVLGKNKRMDLGDYPELSLMSAREIALRCRTWLAEGYDPKLQRDLARMDTLQAVTVEDALEYWLTEYAEEHRTNAGKHRSQFARHIYPYIGSLPLEQTETRHWIECLDRIKKGINGKQKPAPVAAGYVLQNAKQALRFCRVRRYATSRVLDDLTVNDVGQKQRKRDRIFKSSELSDLWKETDCSGNILPYYRNLLKLLIIFGPRTQEIRLSKWDEWDFEEMLWKVPKLHSKTRKQIIRPIPKQILPWLIELKHSSDDTDLILGELKNSATVSQHGRFLWKRLEHDSMWTLHDIRRTFATRLNELGVAPYLVEQMLGHSLGGVMAIYNHSDYIPEKKQVLEMWLDHLDVISASSNVVSIKKHA